MLLCDLKTLKSHVGSMTTYYIATLGLLAIINSSPRLLCKNLVAQWNLAEACAPQ